MYRGLFGGATYLPDPLRAKLRRFAAHLLVRRADVERDYQAWIHLYGRIDETARRAATAHIARLDEQPLISILINHLGVYRRSLMERLGGFRVGLEGSQDYDLALRAVAETALDRIVHIPRVLYHWRQAGRTRSFSESARDRCASNGRRAVQEFLETEQPGACVEPAPSVPAWNRVIYPIPRPEPLVSIIIPTRNHAKLLYPNGTIQHGGVTRPGPGGGEGGAVPAGGCRHAAALG